MCCHWFAGAAFTRLSAEKLIMWIVRQTVEKKTMWAFISLFTKTVLFFLPSPPQVYYLLPFHLLPSFLLLRMKSIWSILPLLYFCLLSTPATLFLCAMKSFLPLDCSASSSQSKRSHSGLELVFYLSASVCNLAALHIMRYLPHQVQGVH